MRCLVKLYSVTDLRCWSGLVASLVVLLKVTSQRFDFFTKCFGSRFDHNYQTDMAIFACDCLKKELFAYIVDKTDILDVVFSLLLSL